MLSRSQVDALSASYRNSPHSNGSTSCHDRHQFLLWWQYYFGFFTCKPIHLEDDLFRATKLNHRLSEPLVTDKSIMNVLVLFLSTPLYKLFCRVEFFAIFFLPIPVTVWPALPDAEVRDSEEIQHGRDILHVFRCIISQKVSTCAVYNSCTAMLKTHLALQSRLHVDYLAKFSVPSSCNYIF